MYSLKTNKKALIRKILGHPLLQEKPPILIDIGASGRVHQAWKLLAKYSICIAFDADTREFNVSQQDHSGYKSLFVVNRVVTPTTINQSDFYLTNSPYCSSLLEPDLKSLESWAFHDLFIVREKTSLPTITLNEALSKTGYDYIDWYKTDSQGTDLRIFDSLPINVRKHIIAAEFEPGILDSYKNEDKLFTLMAYMQEMPFWVTSMRIRGTQRIDLNQFRDMCLFKRRFIKYSLRTAPGWCETVYLNELASNPSERDLLLGWVIATIKSEHGFAINLARQGAARFGDKLFDIMHSFSLRELNSVSGYFKITVAGLKKLTNKFI